MATTIEITVKTLDSQNHQFSVAEDMTVKDFKEEISPQIGIPADQQRLIFRGRVLQDEKKISECNVANNTVHVVQRPANASSNRNNDEPSRSNNDRPGLDIGHGTNAIIMGAIGLPSMEVHSETGAPNGVARRNSAAIRLQVGNQMLGRASTLLRRLEEDDSVLAATASVDTSASSSTAIDGQNQTQDLRQEHGGAGDGSPMDMEIDLDDQNSFNRMISQVANAASSAALVAAFRPAPSNTGNGNSGSGNSNSVGNTEAESGRPTDSNNSGTSETGAANSRRPEAPRLREMAVVLQDILAVQERVSPFLQYVQSTLQANRLYEDTEELQSTQYVFDTVSSIMHYLSHTYHALSDIMCDFTTPPETRRLRAAASILVEQSTVVRATIPIAVPASMLSGNNMPQMPGNTSSSNSLTSTPGRGNNNVPSSQPQVNSTNPGITMTSGTHGHQQQIPINFGGMGAGGFDLSALLGPAIAGGMMPMFMNQNMAQPRPSNSSGPNTPTQNQIPSNNSGGQTPRTQGTATNNGGRGGNGGANMAAQHFRNERSRTPFDILLSCHSHHGGRNQAQRNTRPANLHQYVNVSDGLPERAIRSPSENFLFLCFDFIQQSNILNVLQPVFQDVIQNYLMRGRDAKNSSHIRSCAKTLAKKISPFLESFTDKIHKRNDKIVYSETYCNIITKFFTEALQLTLSTDSNPQYKVALIRAFEGFLRELVTVFKVCFSESQGYLRIFVRAVVEKLLGGTSLIFKENATKNLIDYFSEIEKSVENDVVPSVIVYKEKVSTAPSTSISQAASVATSSVSAPRPVVTERSAVDEVQPPKQPKQNLTPSPARVASGQSMDEDIDDLLNLTAPRTGQASAPIGVNNLDDSLRNIPTDWVETVRRDLRNQLGMPEQPPFSPGYVTLLSRKP